MTQCSFQLNFGLDGLERLAPEWEALLATIPDARFNQFPEWYRAYLSSLESDPGRVCFITAHRGGKLVAIFPMQLQVIRMGPLNLRLLGMIEHDQMMLSDFVFAQTAENEGLLFELTRWLRSQRTIRWDELRLRKVSDESSIAFAAQARQPRATQILKFYASAYFTTKGTYEQATQAIRSKFRSNLRRRNRIAAETALLWHRVYHRPDELGAAFDIFLDIEASGWKGEAGTSSAIRCRPAMHAFYSAIVREFGARQACVINLLWHGEQPVAGELCVKIGKTLNILKVGFSEAHAKFAPGLLLLERMIRQACDDPELEILHLVNNPEWAKFFRPHVTIVWCYFLPNWTLRGLIVHLGFLLKHRWERRWREDAHGDPAKTDVEP